MSIATCSGCAFGCSVCRGRAASQRWVKVCSDCWYERHPDQYFPATSVIDECAVCGYTAFVVSAHPADFPAIALKEAPLTTPQKRSVVTSKVTIYHTDPIPMDIVPHRFGSQVIGPAIRRYLAENGVKDAMVDTATTGELDRTPRVVPDPVLDIFAKLPTSAPSAFSVRIDGVEYVAANFLSAQGWEVRRRGVGQQPALGFIGRSSFDGGLFKASPSVGQAKKFERGDEAIRYLRDREKAMSDLGSSLEVSITKADLAEAVQREKDGTADRPRTCVYAQALKRITGREWNVTSTYAYPSDDPGTMYDLPLKAQDQIREFDKGNFDSVVTGVMSTVQLNKQGTV